MCALLDVKAREQGKQAPSIDDALQAGAAVRTFSARPRECPAHINVQSAWPFVSANTTRSQAIRVLRTAHPE